MATPPAPPPEAEHPPPLRKPPTAGRPQARRVATDAQLEAFLADNNGHLVLGAPMVDGQIVGVEFALVDGCSKHAVDEERGSNAPCIAAIAIAIASQPTRPYLDATVVLLLHGIENTKLLVDSFRRLWSDASVTKVVYAVDGAAAAWRARFGSPLLDAEIGTTSMPRATIDLQLLLEAISDSSTQFSRMVRLASPVSTDAAVNQWSLLNRSIQTETERARSAIQRSQFGEEKGCQCGAVPIQIQQQIMQNARRLADNFRSLRLAPFHWRHVLEPQVTRSTIDRCVTAAPIPVLQSLAPNVALAPDPQTKREQQGRCIATTAQLEEYLSSNKGRLVVFDGRPQVVGIDFLLSENCIGHANGTMEQHPSPCLAGIAIASEVLRLEPIVLLVEKIDKKLLAKALNDLCVDDMIVKAMYELSRPAVAWHTHLGVPFFDDSRMTKCVDLQLLFKHAVDPALREVDLSELAMIAKVNTLDSDVVRSFDAIRDSSGSFTRYGHRLASCSPTAITSEVINRMVQKARLLAIIYMRLRVRPQQLENGGTGSVKPAEWKRRLGEVSSLTSTRCAMAVGSYQSGKRWSALYKPSEDRLQTSTPYWIDEATRSLLVPSTTITPTDAEFVIIETTEQLQKYLNANTGRLYSAAPQVVGIDFLLANNCRGHGSVAKEQGGSCVSAIAVVSHLRQPAAVVAVHGIDKKLLLHAFQILLADDKVVKVMFALQQSAIGWYNRFGKQLSDAGSSSPASKTVDLQLLFEHAVDSSRRDVSVADLAAAVNLEEVVSKQLGLSSLKAMRASSGSFQLHRHCLSSCQLDAVKPPVQKQLVDNARLLTAIYFHLRIAPSHLITADPAEWRYTLSEVTRRTGDRCLKATRGIVNVATSMASEQSKKKDQRQVVCISTTAQLQKFLNRNSGRLVVADGSPQVVGIDFLLSKNCDAHVDSKTTNHSPCLAAIAIASDMLREPPLVVLVQSIDKNVLLKALRDLLTDSNLAKAMQALQIPGAAWHSHFGSHLLDGSLMTKCVDLQLLFEHGINKKRRDVTLDELVTVAGADSFIEKLASLFNFGAVKNASGVFERYEHHLPRCNPSAIPSEIQDRLVQNAQVLAIIYMRLRMLPLPLGAKYRAHATTEEWKLLLTQVASLSADRCRMKIASNGSSQPSAGDTTSTKPPIEQTPTIPVREFQIVSSTKELQSYLGANNGRLFIGTPQVIGIDFMLTTNCQDHAGSAKNPCIGAVGITSNLLNSPALVLLVRGIDKKLLMDAFQDLWADDSVAKVMYALQQASIGWHTSFGRMLLDTSASSMSKTVDLQLLFEHAVIPAQHDASIAALAAVTNVDSIVSTVPVLVRLKLMKAASGDFQLYERHLPSCYHDAMTPSALQQLVQNGRLLATIFLRLGKSDAARPISTDMSVWNLTLAEVTRFTVARCARAVRDVSSSESVSMDDGSSSNTALQKRELETLERPPDSVSRIQQQLDDIPGGVDDRSIDTSSRPSTSSDDRESAVQEPPATSASDQRQVRCIATNAQLDTFLAGNDGRLVFGNPQAVGVDFMLVDNCREHSQGAAPCLAAITIASDNASDNALTILPQKIDNESLVDAFRALWADVNVTKVMHALHRPAVAWRARFGCHLVDEAPPASDAETPDLQSVLERAADDGSHVFLDSSAIKKCVDLQLLLEHVVDAKQRNASVLQLASAANIDTAAHQLALSNFSYKSVTVTNGHSHGHASCSRDAVTNVSIQRMVQNAQLFATIHSSVRMLPLPVGAEDASVVNASEWKQTLVEVTRMTVDRCVNSVANNGTPSIWFDKRADYQPRSLECLIPNRVNDDREASVSDAEEDEEAIDDDDDATLPLHRLQLQCEIDPLLAVLPQKYRDAVTRIDQFRDRLVDVCLDVGRTPYAYVGKRQRVPLDVVGDEQGAAPVVSKSDVEEILELLGGETRIGSDNRAGIDAQLHRVSVMRSKTREVYGVTMRVGRALFHAASALSDLLLGSEHREKSVLLLGHPGSGKTTLIRDVARCVSETQENVCIIDTSNEIGGDGLVPHACIGWARRMMVPSLEMQASVMVECVQNHTVETMVVDEIGRKAEVLAASTVRQRGPRLVASAHGDFHSLMKNPDLRGLVGGMQQVTVGDAEAKASGLKGKLRTERAGNPIFDVIVELDRQAQGVCHIVWDVAAAVDSVLAGKPMPKAESRRWNASTRGVQVLSS